MESVFWVTKEIKECVEMGNSKLFKQDQEINNFVYMFALEMYSKAIFRCKWWNWAPLFLLLTLVVYMQINNAQTCPSA